MAILTMAILTMAYLDDELGALRLLDLDTAQHGGDGHGGGALVKG